MYTVPNPQAIHPQAIHDPASDTLFRPMKVAHQGGFASYTFGSETLFRQLHIAGKFVDYPYTSKSTQCASDVRHILD